jgi:mono/diheme cytochrome c family protein
MSSPNPHSKPDLDETINVTQAHARVASEFSAATREKHLAESGRESVPLWVITACGVVLLIAGGVLGNAGTLFSYDNTFRANYVRGTAPGGADSGPQPKTALMAFSAKGSKIYSAKCNGCHGADGKGDGANYPSLVGSTFVIEENQKLAMVILNGIQGPISNGKTYGAGIMPAQGAGMTPAMWSALRWRKAPLMPPPPARKLGSPSPPRKSSPNTRSCSPVRILPRNSWSIQPHSPRWNELIFLRV